MRVLTANCTPVKAASIFFSMHAYACATMCGSGTDQDLLTTANRHWLLHHCDRCWLKSSCHLECATSRLILMCNLPPVLLGQFAVLPLRSNESLLQTSCFLSPFTSIVSRITPEFGAKP